jgi:hypothetical protein
MGVPLLEAINHQTNNNRFDGLTIPAKVTATCPSQRLSDSGGEQVVRLGALLSFRALN